MQPQMPGDQVSPHSNPNPSPNPVVMPAGAGVPIAPQRPGKRKLLVIAGAAEPRWVRMHSRTTCRINRRTFGVTP